MGREEKPDVAPGPSPPGHFPNKVQRHTYWTPVAVFPGHFPIAQPQGHQVDCSAWGPRVGQRTKALLSELEGLRQGPPGLWGEGCEAPGWAPRLRDIVQLEGISCSQDLAFLVIPGGQMAGVPEMKSL